VTSPTQGGKPRRRLSADERRSAILESAEAVFARTGYHGSSIDDIASQAGISKALIYEHFPSKKDLHASLLETSMGELFDRIARNAATDEPGDVRLRAGIDAFLGWVEERRGAFRMIFRDAVDPEVADQLRRVVEQVTVAVAAMMATEPRVPVQTGEDTELGIRILAQQLTGGLQTMALWWEDHPEVSRTTLVDATMDLYWMGLERVRDGERYRTSH
jgi:AcrR family transcriptional regulator